MRQCWLFVIILMSMVGSNAQTFVGTCPIPEPALQWTNESASSLGLTSFGGRIDIFGSFTVNVSTFNFFGAEVGVLSDGDIYTVTILSENGPLLTEKLFIAR